MKRECICQQQQRLPGITISAVQAAAWAFHPSAVAGQLGLLQF